MSDPTKHPYSALCGCNDCEIEGHAQDNIGDVDDDLEHPGSLSNQPDDLENEVTDREREEWDGLSEKY